MSSSPKDCSTRRRSIVRVWPDAAVRGACRGARGRAAAARAREAAPDRSLLARRAHQRRGRAQPAHDHRLRRLRRLHDAARITCPLFRSGSSWTCARRPGGCASAARCASPKAPRRSRKRSRRCPRSSACAWSRTCERCRAPSAWCSRTQLRTLALARHASFAASRARRGDHAACAREPLHPIASTAASSATATSSATRMPETKSRVGHGHDARLRRGIGMRDRMPRTDFRHVRARVGALHDGPRDGRALGRVRQRRRQGPARALR